MVFSLEDSAQVFHLLIRPIDQLRGRPEEIWRIAEAHGFKAVWELLELSDEELGRAGRAVLVDMFNITDEKRTITHALRSLLVQVRNGVLPDTTDRLTDADLRRAARDFSERAREFTNLITPVVMH